MATKWRLAKSLIRLRDQINQLAPHRSKVSDGSVGDTSHSARVSDHNPDSKGVVAAIDVTHDHNNGMNGHALAYSVIKDPRTKYVIFSGSIWKARTGKWETYRGPNPHRHHVHVSVQPATYDDDSAWGIDLKGSPVKPSRPVLKLGDRGQEVRVLQAKLGITVDGQFGYGTQKAVMQFQEKHGLEVDGKVGEKTWQKLG